MYIHRATSNCYHWDAVNATCNRVHAEMARKMTWSSIPPICHTRLREGVGKAGTSPPELACICTWVLHPLGVLLFLRSKRSLCKSKAISHGLWRGTPSPRVRWRRRLSQVLLVMDGPTVDYGSNKWMWHLIHKIVHQPPNITSPCCPRYPSHPY